MRNQPDIENASILAIERLNNSRNGNPRYKVYLANESGTFPSWAGVWLTSSDAMVNYDVENLYHAGKLVNVWLTKAGRICRMEQS